MSSFFRKNKQEQSLKITAATTHEASFTITGKKMKAAVGDKGQLLENESERTISRALYCIVLPTKVVKKQKGLANEKDLEAYRQTLVNDFVEAGLDCTLFYSVQKDEIYLKVGCNDERLLQQADVSEYQLQLDPVAIEKVAETPDENRRPLRLEAPFDHKTQRIEHKFLGRWVTLDESGDHWVTSYMRTLTHLSPWKFLHAKYNDAWEKYHKTRSKVQIYRVYHDGTILRVVDRMNLIQQIMESPRTVNVANDTKGAGRNLAKMVHKKQVLAVFPLQTAAGSMDSGELTVDELYRKWSTLFKLPWDQPIGEIRNYFGEKVALYFAFLGHYTKWLAFSAIVGLALFFHQLGELSKGTDGKGTFLAPAKLVNDSNGSPYVVVYTDVPEIGIFAGFMALWATFMLEFWKRKQAAYAMYWGTSSFEKSEVVRPEFLPTAIYPNPVTGRAEPYYNPVWYQTKVVSGFVVIGMMMCMVVAIIAGIFIFKVFVTLPGKTGMSPQDGTYLALVINAIVINILGSVFKGVAKALNDWENHRTDTAYEDALIMKTFLFCFTNSYATLFYMAFIKSGTEILGQVQLCQEEVKGPNDTIIARDACFGNLGSSLLIIFLLQLVLSNTLEVLIPTINGALKRRANLKVPKATKAVEAEEKLDARQRAELDKASLRKISEMRSPAEDQFFKKSYEGTFDDFLEITLQFGYVTLFVAAFPLAPFLAFVNNQLEIRVDSYKLARLCRRPVTQMAQDIGTWQTIFYIMGIIAVMTNAGVVFFTSHSIIPPDWIPVGAQAFRAWMWVLAVGVILIFKFAVDLAVPDVPGWVQIQLDRQDYIVRKCLAREPDDDEAEAREEGVETMAAKTVAYKIEDSDPAINELGRQLAKLFLEHAGSDAERAFSQADRSGNGVISVRELKRYLKSVKGIAEKLTEDEIDALVGAIDVNGSGDIDYNEFMTFMKRSTA